MRLNSLKRQASGAALAFACNSAKLAIAGFIITTCLAPFHSTAADVTRRFDIPAGTLEQALEGFSAQSGLRVIGDYQAASRASTPGVKGSYTNEDALKAIVAGSDLEIAQIAGDRVSLRLKTTEVGDGSASSPWLPSGQSDQTEVVVTGTRIRGGNPTSPVRTISAKDIEQSGYQSIGDVMRSLPENFSGGQNPGVLGADAGGFGNKNQTGASTVNLRGLGTDATLLLVNGHRLSADGFSQASDISGVPLSAVQHIDIVPDGASALYGSDAVAGVVNVILRKSFSGTEIKLTGGAGSQGAATNRQASILTGFQASAWFGMANLELQNQDAVQAKDRVRTQTVTPQTTLIPGIARKSLFFSGGRSLGDNATLSLDALLTERVQNQTLRITPTSAVQQNTATTPAFTAAVNFDTLLGGNWKLHVSDLISASRNSLWTYFPARNTRSYFRYRNSTDAIEATLDGSLITLPSGDVKVAVGGGVRHETFSYPVSVSRDVRYAFAETSIPLVQPSSTRTGLHELELDASARREGYSTHIEATDPKVGLRYVPFTGMTVRTSWGQSFKAPTFLQLYSPRLAYLINAADLGYGTSGVVLTALGGNPDLKPEKSTSWTLNASYTPPSRTGLELSATYFNVHYTDRVTTPTTAIFGALSTGTYAPFVTPSPTSVEVTGLVSGADFANISSSTYDPARVAAIFRDSYVNASSQNEQGVDIGYRQTFSTSRATISTFANATVLQLKQRLIPTSQTVELSGKIFYTPKAKVRAGLSYQKQNLSVTVIGNYVAKATDNGVTPNGSIGSSMTADLALSYAFRGHNVDELKVALSTTNIFDRKPPFAYSPARVYGGLNYDSTNASILGRYTSFSVTKTF